MSIVNAEDPALPAVHARAFNPHIPTLPPYSHRRVGDGRFEVTYEVQFNIFWEDLPAGAILVNHDNHGVVVVTLPDGYQVAETAVEKPIGRAWALNNSLGLRRQLLDSLVIQQINEGSGAKFEVSQPHGHRGIATLVIHVKYQAV